MVLATLSSVEGSPASFTARTASLLEAGGEMLLVSRTKGLEPASDDLGALSMREITEDLTPLDFVPRPHLRVWRIGLSDAR